MKSFTDRNPYAIGVVSVLVIAAATGFAFMVGILHLLEDTYTVQAVFSDAAGIRAGDDVRVAGVKAGRVDSVRADRRAGTVVIELEVNSGVALGVGATAEVALETLLGTKFVRLGGPVLKPYLEDVPEAQRRIPLERTKTPFDVFELTRIGTRTAQQTDTEKLNRLITDLADVTEGKHDQVKQLVDGITTVSDAITTRDEQLSSLLARADRLSGTLAEKDQTLVGLIDRSQAVLSLVERRRADIRTGLSKGATAVDQLAQVITANKSAIDAILDTLHPAVDVVDRRMADIDRALAWFGPGTYGLALAPSHGPWADIYIRNLGPDLVCFVKQHKATPEPC